MRHLWTAARYLRPRTLAMSSNSSSIASGQKRSASPTTKNEGKRAKKVSSVTTEDDFDQDDNIDAEVLIAAAEVAESNAVMTKSEPVPATKATATATATAKTPDDPLSLERSTMDPHWFSLLESAMKTPSFRSLKTFLASEKQFRQTIYPPENLIHSWSRSCPLDGVKVVIVGQDPYHGPNQAHGMSFSVPKGIPVPGSLKNIYKELTNEYGSNFVPPKHGNLDGWAKQGVLLLNACLTVRAHQAASHHGKGWEPFTIEILKLLAQRAKSHGGTAGGGGTVASVAPTAQPPPKNATITSMFSKQKAKTQGGSTLDNVQPNKDSTEQSTKDGAKDTPNKDSTEQSSKDSTSSAHTPTTTSPRGGIVFLSWGLPASKTLAAAGIASSTPNVLILQSAHPSPLSAHRGFLGNGHFKKANEWLTGPGGWGEGGGVEWGNL